jgi:acyl-CoA thioesterase-1
MLTSNPDIVVVMLGSNDAKKPTWDKTGVEEFKKNYPLYLKAFKDLPSKPKVFAAIPPAVLPCFDAKKDPNTVLNTEVINDVLPKILPELIKSVEGVELVDIRKFMGGGDKAE